MAPPILACLDIEIKGKREKLVKGVEVAALPALEPMVHAPRKTGAAIQLLHLEDP